MKKLMITVCAACAAGLAFAAFPTATVDNVTVTPETGFTVIAYTLSDGPAIVTCDVLTNGAPVARRVLRSMAGDVNRLVTNKTCRIYWQPRFENGPFTVPAGKMSVKLTAHRKGFPPNYMVVDLKNKSRRAYYESEDDLPYGIEHPRYRMNFMVFRKIPASGATFVMGSPESEPGRTTANEAYHRVSFTNDYYLGVFELTRGQYLMYLNPPELKDGQVDDWSMPMRYFGYEGSLRGWRSSNFRWPQDGHAVGNTAYYLGAFRNASGLMVDYPTESQWEFAARAGSTTALPDGLRQESNLAATDNVCTNTGKYAWYKYNCTGPQPVGLKRPNDWGLYDVLGNVHEGCLDVWQPNNTVYGEVEPPGFETEERTAFTYRGGCYAENARASRLAYRANLNYGSSQWDRLGARIWCQLPED